MPSTSNIGPAGEPGLDCDTVAGAASAYPTPHQAYSDAVVFGATAGVLISDGGLATELEARGHNLSDALWSARLLQDAPEEIRAVHSAYFRAGAVIATTASYQASFTGFAARGIDRHESTRLLHRSVALAQAARAEFTDGRRRWVAASIGPYGAALADSSEYRGRYGLSVAALRAWHRPRVEVLAQAGPDVFALETIPDLDEAEALVSLVAELDVPAWLSYTVDGDRTRAGQPLDHAFALATHVPRLVAVGVNCCAPADVDIALDIAHDTGKPLIAYPNSGEEWDAGHRAWTGHPRFSPARAARWISRGAMIIGGCCRVTPADISCLAQRLSGQP